MKKELEGENEGRGGGKGMREEEEEEPTHLDASAVGDVFRERIISVEIVRAAEFGNLDFHVRILASETLTL